MKNRLLAASMLAIAVLALCACKPVPTHHDAATLAAQTDAGLFLSGTLAALGSFEWDAAPLLNHAAVSLHGTAVALKERRITVDTAQGRMNQIDRAHDLVMRALASCAQDDRTGKCTKDEAGARSLLDQARAALSDIP